MASLRDHERGAGANEPRALPQDHLEPARVLAAGEVAGPRRRLDVVEASDASFRLRDDLVRDDDHVPVLELGPAGNQRRKVVSLPHPRQALHGDHAQLVARIVQQTATRLGGR